MFSFFRTLSSTKQVIVELAVNRRQMVNRTKVLRDRSLSTTRPSQSGVNEAREDDSLDIGIIHWQHTGNQDIKGTHLIVTCSFQRNVSTLQTICQLYLQGQFVKLTRGRTQTNGGPWFSSRS